MIFRIWLVALAAAVIAAVLVVGTIAAVFAVLWALLTGRKPAAFAVFKRFQRASQEFPPRRRTDHGGRGAASVSDVVDVQAREMSQVITDHSPPSGG